MTQSNDDWLADEYGDLRPEAAQALGGLAEQTGSRPAARTRRTPQARRPAVPLPSWLPAVFITLVVVLGLAQGAKFVTRKWRDMAETRAEEAQSFVTTVAVPNAKLRAEPGTYSAIRLILQPNWEVKVLELRDGWARVLVDETKGWIYGGLLRSVGDDVLGPATILKPITVRTETGPIVLYLGQKVLIEGHAGSGYVIAVLPDGRRANVPSTRLLFTAAGS